MNVHEIVKDSLSTGAKRDKALRQIVKDKAFAAKCPNAHRYLASCADFLDTRGELTDPQKKRVYFELQKYIPIAIQLKAASQQQLAEMNNTESAEGDRHVENDGAE